MPFPLIIPLAAATAKAATSYAIWYLGGGGVVLAGSGILYQIFKKEPPVPPLKPSITALHATKEKIDKAFQEGRKKQLELSMLDEQITEELVKANISYAELAKLLETRCRDLTDAAELEVIIEKISTILGNDSRLIEVLKQKISMIAETLSPSQQHSIFNSTEFQQHQLEMQAIVENFVGSSGELDEISYGLNPA